MAPTVIGIIVDIDFPFLTAGDGTFTGDTGEFMIVIGGINLHDFFPFSMILLVWAIDLTILQL